MHNTEKMKSKYLKYKSKYMKLKKQMGGSIFELHIQNPILSNF